MWEKVGAVLVIGAGVGGIKAALDLAESGFQVYLVDRSSTIGGTVAQLEKWFPDNGCELCKLLPTFNRDECSQFCLRRNFSHPNIEFIPNTRVEKVEGQPGNFEISIKKESRWLIRERCIGCSDCIDVCPVEVPDEFTEGLQNRKAVYVENPQILPNVYTIDREYCTRCGKCMEICPTSAIDLYLPDESSEIVAGAIIIATGLEEYDAAEMGQYGFGRYANILNNTQLERLLASAGLTGGKLLRPSDGEVPQKIAFLQCVGSRDMKRNYCSAACCMYAVKEAILIKEQNREAQVTIFYMDLRAFGKGYYQYYLKAKDLGVKFIRSRASTIRENPQNRNLQVVARAEDGRSISSEFDLVVLSIGQCPSRYTAELSQVLGVDVNKWGFIETPDFWPVRTSREGIYVCGSAIGPADITETVVQASAAAAGASVLLSSTRDEMVAKKIEHTEVKASDEDAKIAVFICQCGQEIDTVVDVEQIIASVQTIPVVTHIETDPYLCLPETLENVKQTVTEIEANRVVLCACAPYHYQKLFNDMMREVGIDSSLWQLVNFREQIAWVHKDNKPLATDKALSALAMTIEQLRVQESVPITSIPINHQCLIIGGGISGLISALYLAEQGFDVHLLEKTTELGGHAKEIYYDLGNQDPQGFINDILEKVKTNGRINLYLEAELLEISGHAGDFHTRVKVGEDINILEHGAVIIATGAKDYQPTEYQYGQNERIITQKELQKCLTEGNIGEPSAVVMIQCVGSRNEEHPYCNRTCCSEAIVNALEIKKQRPDTNVYILNRDIMTYGFTEEYYTQAREADILFIRYEQGREPDVNINNEAITVTVNDPALPGSLEIEADLLALSTGIVAGDNQQLAEILSLELTEDGFFKEVDTKFRPVDTLVDGVFVCGLAHAPKSLNEEIVQAQAAAQRASGLLVRDKLESGRIVSEVDERRCSGCGLCVTVCPFKARWIDEERKVAIVEEPLCQGCGTCVALCPNGAAELRGLKDKQILSMIEVAL